MASTLKRRRIIVLVHKSLVPPDDISKLPFEEIAPYKTEFDVREGLLSLGHEWQLGLTSRPWALVPMGLMVLYLIVLGIYPTDFSTAWPSALFCVGVLGIATAFLCAPIPRTRSTLERESRAVVGSFGVAFLALLIVNPIIGGLLGDTAASTISIWGVALLFHGCYVLVHSIMMTPLPDRIRALLEAQPAMDTS